MRTCIFKRLWWLLSNKPTKVLVPLMKDRPHSCYGDRLYNFWKLTIFPHLLLYLYSILWETCLSFLMGHSNMGSKLLSQGKQWKKSVEPWYLHLLLCETSHAQDSLDGWRIPPSRRWDNARSISHQWSFLVTTKIYFCCLFQGRNSLKILGWSQNLREGYYSEEDTITQHKHWHCH